MVFIHLIRMGSKVNSTTFYLILFWMDMLTVFLGITLLYSSCRAGLEGGGSCDELGKCSSTQRDESFHGWSSSMCHRGVRR